MTQTVWAPTSAFATRWTMWFGRCYRVNDVIVDTFTTALDDTLRLLDVLCAANRPSEGCIGERRGK